MPANDCTMDEIVFEQGLVGCEDWKRFVLLDCEDAGPVRLLQCLDDAEVGFLVADPHQILDGYRLEMTDADRDAIALENLEDAVVLCTLIVRHEPLEVTANLLGPLVINRGNGRGIQVVLSGSGYSTRHLIATAAGEGP